MGKDLRWFRRHSSQVVASATGHAWVAASGLVGEGEIVVTPSLRRPLLVKPAKPGKDGEPPPPPPKQEPLLKVDYPVKAHLVRLHFSDPDDLPPGDRVFSVMLQGKTVLENFDIAKAAGKNGGVVVREFKGIEIGADLRVELRSIAGSKAPPVLCGVEFAAE